MPRHYPAVKTWILRSHPFLFALCAVGCARMDASDGYGDDGYTEDDPIDDAGMVSAGDDGIDDGDEGAAEDNDDDGAEESGDDEGIDTEDTPACNDADDVALFLSPDDSNSMSSPVQAREGLLAQFGSISGIAIRPWEFLNYYRIAYPAAEPGTVGVHAAMMMNGDDYVLQIGVASEAMTNETRPPMNLTFVLDTSGSMAGHSLEMLQATCRQIAANLREGDVVSMVTWNTQNNVVLSKHAVTGPNDAELLDAIDSVTADGGTDLHGGLVAGYQLAAASHREGIVSRVLLVSDGGANVGVTDEELIAQHAGDQGSDGIYLVGVGVGDSTTYNDLLMDRVTDVGKGASVFVPSAGEAELAFGARFVSTMAIAARDVQVRLDLPPGFEIVRFSGEEYSTDPAEIEPQHLAPDDAMVFHQHLSTCAPEAVTDDTPVTITVRYQDALTFEPHEVALATTFAELLAADRDLLLEGAAVFDYATALQTKNSGAEANDEIARARASLALAREAQPDDTDLAEIAAVLDEL
jgi:Ca-activated chloride channel family protein